MRRHPDEGFRGPAHRRIPELEKLLALLSEFLERELTELGCALFERACEALDRPAVGFVADLAPDRRPHAPRREAVRGHTSWGAGRRRRRPAAEAIARHRRRLR